MARYRLPKSTTARLRDRATRLPNPVTYWSRPYVPGATVMVVAAVRDVGRRVSCTPAGDLGAILVAPSHDGGVPTEWHASAFWRRFHRIEIDRGVSEDIRSLIEPVTIVSAARADDKFERRLLSV